MEKLSPYLGQLFVHNENTVFTIDGTVALSQLFMTGELQLTNTLITVQGSCHKKCSCAV